MATTHDLKAFQRRFWQTIQGKLILLLILLFIPTLLIQAYVYQERFKASRAEQLQANLEIARAVAKAFDSFVQDVLHQELSIGIAFTSSQPLSDEEKNAILFRNQAGNPAIWHFFWDNPAGMVVASTGSRFIGMDISDREFYRQIIAGKDWVVSDLLLSKTTHQPSFTISRGIRNERGELLGIIVAGILPKRLEEVLGLRRSEGGGVGLLDKQGRLVYRFPETEVSWEERDWLSYYPEQVQAVLDGKEITAEVFARYSQKQRLVGFSPIPSIGWAAAAGRTEEVAMAAVTSTLLPQTILFLLLTVVIFAISLVFSRRISTSVARLRNHALSLGRGEKQIPVAMSGTAELDDLANAFNKMTEELQSREREQKRVEDALRESEGKYRTLFENMAEEVHFWQFVRDEAGRIRTWRLVDANPSALNTWGQTALDEIKGKTTDEIFGPGSTDHYMPVVQKITTEGVPYSFEDYFPNLDRYFRFTSVPLEDCFITTGADITGIKKAERAIRESEERLQALMNALPVGVSFSDDANCQCITGNPAVLAQFEVAPEDNLSASAADPDAPGRQVRFFLKDREISDIELPLQRAVAENQEIPPMELEVLLPSGRRWFAEASGAPIRSVEGKVIGGVAVTMDITERKWAEARLREYEKAMEGLEEMIAVVDRDYRYLIANRAFLKYRDLAREQVVGRFVGEILGKEVFKKNVKEKLDECFQGNIVKYEMKHNYSTLGERDLFISYLPIEGPSGVDRVACVLQDITERRQLEEELRKSRDELELRVQERTIELRRVNENLRDQAALLDLAHDAILVRDLRDRVVFWNQGAEKTYGWKRDEVRGMVTNDLLQTRCFKLPEEIWTHLMESGIWEGELHHSTRDGSRIIVESRQALQRNPNGDPRGVLEINRDVTETRNMEKQLTRADRLSSMGVLAGGIAHEIRNPLYAMSLFLDVLTDEEKFNRTSHELNVFHEIKLNIKRIDGIIRRVLDFSRQSASISQKIDAGVLIEQSLELWKSKMAKSSIKLGLSVEENLPEVIGDPIEMQQVLTNLIQNAVEAMKQNGALGVVVESGTLSFDKKRSAVIIKVQDSGPGIPLDQQKNIFTPFFTTKYTGTGLGLAISHRIISRHGGLISFESVPGGGTTFTVELPVALES